MAARRRSMPQPCGTSIGPRRRSFSGFGDAAARLPARARNLDWRLKRPLSCCMTITPTSSRLAGANLELVGEFQIGWSLWKLDTGGSLDARWVREPRLVRVTGFGPLFDEAAFELGRAQV